MGLYTSYDYLCNEPYIISGVGLARCPTLRDIRQITYNTFSFYVNMLRITLDEYLESYELTEQYNLLDDKDKEKNTLFNLIFFGQTKVLYDLLDFFIIGNIVIDEENIRFNIYKNMDLLDESEQTGYIDSSNFEIVRNELKCILGMISHEDVEPKFKNNLARKLYEKMQKNPLKQKNDSSDDFTFDNMIKKYCANNETGINILNVWELTYFQFITMFHEYCHSRKCNFNFYMATSSFNFKKSSEYIPMEWMKKIENN